MWLLGRASRTPAGATTKKFTRKESQSTWRRLVYIGGYQDLKNRFASDLDVGNAIVDHLQLQQVRTDFEVTSHELRLESAGERRVDYNLGLWYSDTETDTKLHQSA